MTDTKTELFALTKQIIADLNLSGKRVEPHDPADKDDEDVIYLDDTPPSVNTDGEVISVEHFPRNDHYMISCETAHHFGGWPTNWSSSTGPQDLVLAQLKEHLK